ncbi:hypothetical protein K502DRAFT_203752 [Neoconidiobolus thromboides FSU 785]|nr:hypothetical protein K502DRAFT_203752 [Neoconidiobolus thromboides FSU 785]
MDQSRRGKRNIEELQTFPDNVALINMTSELTHLLKNSSQTTPLDFPQSEELNKISDLLSETEYKVDVFDIALTSLLKNYDDVLIRLQNRSSHQRYKNNSSRQAQSATNSPNLGATGSTSSRFSSYTPVHASSNSAIRKASLTKMPIKKGNIIIILFYFILLFTTETVDEAIDSRKGSTPNLYNSDKRPVINRRRTAESIKANPLTKTPETPTKENVLAKPTNNRLASLKDESFESPSPSLASPVHTNTMSYDPNHRSSLLIASESEPTYAHNATAFQDFRPKMVVNKDFSKAKGTFSVPIQTFLNYAEGYLRPLTEGDLKILEPKEVDPSLYEIPENGKNYKEVWEEEDRDAKASSNGKEPEFTPAPDQPYFDDPSFFTHRLYSALLPVVGDRDDASSEAGSENSEEMSPSETHQVILENKPNPTIFEDRLKEELCPIGLLDAEAKPEPEYDEITLELIKLQTQLRDLNKYNNAKKMKLKKIAEEHLAYQEYTKAMDTLDSKLEQSYAKRQVNFNFSNCFLLIFIRVQIKIVVRKIVHNQKDYQKEHLKP